MLSVIANVFSALLNLISFSLIIPILRILFNIERRVTVYIPTDDIQLNSIRGFKEYGNALFNNFSWYIGDLINTQGASTTLIWLGIMLVVLTLVKVGVTYLAMFSMIPIRTGIVRDIRNQINDKIIALPLSFFSEERKGDIIARVSGDVNEVEGSIMSSLDMLLKNPILMLVYLFAMFSISWKLTLFVFILLPVAGFIMGRVGKTLKKQSLDAQNQWGGLMSQIEETLAGLRIIKAFNAEDKIRSRFGKANETFRKTTVRVSARQQLAHPMSEFLGTATIAIVLWYGGSLILNNQSSIDASTFIYYLVIFYSIINPAKELSKSAYAIQKGMASMERIDKILLAENTIKDPQNPVHITFNKQIQFEKVWFKYQNEWVLKDIDITVNKGQTVALVGHSGSGKSTLVDLIPRFYDIQQGSIKIDSTDIRDTTVHELRELMGNVNQEAILFNDSVYNNIAFGVDFATEEEVKRAANIAHADEFIDEMPQGYNTNIGDRGGKLSGGQRQRLSIARAILKNPPILILDEATSALDTTSERLVQEALETLMKDRTTIVIAHRLSTIINADMICVIDKGEIIERGKHQELLALNGEYAKLYNIQMNKGASTLH